MESRRLCAVVVALVVLSACGGDAQPEVGQGPANTGVTFPDTVPPDLGADDPTASPGTVPPAEITAGAPRGFPADFPQPSGAAVDLGTATSVGTDQVLAVDLTVDDTTEAVLRFYRRALDDLGYPVLFDEGDNLRFETDDYVGDVFVSVAPGEGELRVTLTATIPSG